MLPRFTAVEEKYRLFHRTSLSPASVDSMPIPEFPQMPRRLAILIKGHIISRHNDEFMSLSEKHTESPACHLKGLPIALGLSGIKKAGMPRSSWGQPAAISSEFSWRLAPGIPRRRELGRRRARGYLGLPRPFFPCPHPPRNRKGRKSALRPPRTGKIASKERCKGVIDDTTKGRPGPQFVPSLYGFEHGEKFQHSVPDVETQEATAMAARLLPTLIAGSSIPASARFAQTPAGHRSDARPL
jgi:hypothetical protein